MKDNNSGIKLWKKAVKCIPGGNGLLSKRPGRYVPGLWPTYFSKSKGVNIWDLDGKKYIDMAQMGIGTAILGYSNESVNNEVKKAITKGVNTTLNAPEEVYLAEKLLEINKFAGGVKFARTGGEAMAIAVRIARAYTGKDTIAFSGYHGWSDWYLATNIEDENNLNDHLLEGLSPLGVPKSLAGSAIPFKYNCVNDIEKQLSGKEIAAIVIEGARYDFAKKEFLQKVKEVAKRKNAIIILDEITSGWRVCLGGAFNLYDDFTPDIAVYGKAMGNGFAISAIVGKHEIMDASQDTFISSTFWTERVGFIAGLETIKQLQEKNVHDHLVRHGRMISDVWNRLFKKYDLDFKTTEFMPLITFKPNYGEENNKILTVFSQEMLKLNYLASNSIYLSYSHDQKIIEKYALDVEKVFEKIAIALYNNNIDNIIETKIRQSGFERLN